MNKNKGMIGIGLIVAIVLGIIVIGCGAYLFLKKSNNIKKYNGPENTGICGGNGEFCPGTPGYEARMKREKQNQPVAPVVNNQQLNNITPVINSGAKTVSTTNWKTYTNTEYGFSFKYPSNWGTPSGLFNGKVFEVYSKESITVPFINYHPSNNKLTMSDFVGNSWGHDATDVPTKISVAGQIASKFTYETATNGRGQPYPLYNQQVGFPDNKGGFFVINFAVPPAEKENGINLFNQILSTFTLQ